MKTKQSTLWLVLFTVVTIIFILRRIHISTKPNTYHLKHHRRQYRPHDIDVHSKLTRSKNDATKHMSIDRPTLTEQLGNADDLFEDYVERTADDTMKGSVEIGQGDNYGISDKYSVANARRIGEIGNRVNSDTPSIEQKADDSVKWFGEKGPDVDLGTIDKHIEHESDGNGKRIGEIAVDVCNDNIDTCVQQKADDIARTVGNLDRLWFKWLDKTILPDNGHVYASAQDRLTSRRIWTKASCRYMEKAGFKPPNQRTYTNEYIKHFIVNDKHKFLFCYLPKVANTNFRRVFLGLQGVVPKQRVPFISGYNVYFVHDHQFTYIRKFSRSEQHTLLNTYRKFMVIRDPFERLLSGYRNKFFHPNPNNTAEFNNKVTSFYERHTHLLNRNGITVRTDFTQEALKFDEFLVYFVDTYAEGDYLNEHFTASNQLCDPCHRSMDYIAKYDTLFDDVQHIFEKLNIDIPFPGRNDNYYTKETTSVEAAYFSQIPTWLLLKVWHILKFDYVLYGFSLPPWFEERIHLEQSLGLLMI